MKLSPITKSLVPFVLASSLDIPARAAEPNEIPPQGIHYHQQIDPQTSFSYLQTSDGFSTIQINRKDNNIETLIEARNVDNNETIDYFSVQTVFYDAVAINYAFYHGPAYINYMLATHKGYVWGPGGSGPKYSEDYLFKLFNLKIDDIILHDAMYPQLSASEAKTARAELQKEMAEAFLQERYSHLSASEREAVLAWMQKRGEEWKFIHIDSSTIHDIVHCVEDDDKEKEEFSTTFYKHIHELREKQGTLQTLHCDNYYVSREALHIRHRHLDEIEEKQKAIQKNLQFIAVEEMGSVTDYGSLSPLNATPEIRDIFSIFDTMHRYLWSARQREKRDIQKRYEKEIEEIFKSVENEYFSWEYLLGQVGEPEIVKAFVFYMADAEFLRKENSSGDSKIYGVVQYRSQEDLRWIFESKHELKLNSSPPFLNPKCNIFTTGWFSPHLYGIIQEAQKDGKFQISPEENFDFKPAIYEIDLRTLDFTRVLDANGKTIADLRGHYQFHPAQ